LTHIDQLERLQQLILTGESVTPLAMIEASGEKDLKQQAEADPSNRKVVEEWFVQSRNPAEVVAFYNAHRRAITKSAILYAFLANHLAKLQRWNDVIKVADGAMQCVEKDEIARNDDSFVDMIVFRKADALCKLGREQEAIGYLREVNASHPRNAGIQSQLCHRLCSRLDYSSPEKDLLAECLLHASQAASLKPDDYDYVSWASFLARVARDFADALRYAERALALAANDGDRVNALAALADIYESNDLYRDAREHLRQALQIDEHSVPIISNMAHCYYMEDNISEAIRMAKRGLMIDPSDESCQRILGHCEKSANR
jgi:tetratricopeptide (TPR) repeat protein